MTSGMEENNDSSIIVLQQQNWKREIERQKKRK